MTLRSYLRIFRERFKVLALVTVLGVLLAVVVTALSPKVYQSDVQVFVTSNGEQGTASLNDEQAAALSQVTTFAALIDTPQVIASVQSDLHLGISDNELRSKLTAVAPSQQTLVIISATDGNAETAAAIAKSATNAFITVIEDLKRPTDSSKSTVRLFQTSQATVPSSPVSPKPVLNLALGLILGFLAGVALAIARDALDKRIKDPEVLAEVADRPVMGVIVEDPTAARHPIAARAGSQNSRAENFRQLRANLQFANVDAHPRVIAITSSIPTEGKTMVAMNLASTLAEAGFSVCLVDADLRRPNVAKVMGLQPEVGLTSVLINQIALDDALQNAGSNLFVLTSGPVPPNPSEILASSYVRTLIRSLLDKVDYVVVDTAPLLPVADGSEVAALADGTLLVARHKLTTQAEVERARATLNRVDAELIGVVLNRVPNRRISGHGYSYYRADAVPPVSPAVPRKFGRRPTVDASTGPDSES